MGTLHFWPLALLFAACDSGIPNRVLPALGVCEYTATYEAGEVERYEHRAYVERSSLGSTRTGLLCDAEGDGFPVLAPSLEFAGEALVTPTGEPFLVSTEFRKAESPLEAYGEEQDRGASSTCGLRARSGAGLSTAWSGLSPAAPALKVTVEGAYYVRIPSP